MSKVTKLLVPIDFSAYSENALSYAIQLADKINAIVEILYVPPFDAPYLYPTMVAVSKEEKIRISRRRLKSTLKRVIAGIPNLENQPAIQADVEVGVPDTKICEVVDRDQIDYVMMGTQGENSIWDRFLGTTATNVLKYANCPILMIPEQAKFKDEIVMGYATDLMVSDPFEIWKASKLLSAFDPKVLAIHIQEESDRENSKMKELELFFAENATDLDISFHQIIAKDKLHDLNNFILDQDINMMVMYKAQRGFFESFFHQSFTKEMALYTKVPLLILKEKQ